MIRGFKAHISEKYRRMKRELASELRMMLRSQGKPFKIDFVKADAENDAVITFLEIFIDEHNDIFFKAHIANAIECSEHIIPISEMSVDDIFHCIMDISA